MDNTKWGDDESLTSHRHQNEADDQEEIPGDTSAADIVGRTGEEMPEVAHDDGDGEFDDDNETDQPGG